MSIARDPLATQHQRRCCVAIDTRPFHHELAANGWSSDAVTLDGCDRLPVLMAYLSSFAVARKTSVNSVTVVRLGADDIAINGHSQYRLVLDSGDTCVLRSGDHAVPETARMRQGELWRVDGSVPHSLSGGAQGAVHVVFDLVGPACG